MRVAIIGGGAAGFFAALSAKDHHPEAEVTIYEKSDKLLSKVRISGGGRCNVTHHCTEPRKLAKHYPRGEQFLRKAFERFAVRETISWFSEHNVELKTEMDGRMFPTTDSSQTIVDVLQEGARKRGIRIALHCGAKAIERISDGSVRLMIGAQDLRADRAIITTGGHPSPTAYRWLAELGHTIVAPVPSLFTFNMPGEAIRDLMGVVVPARVRIVGTEVESTGPVLITHWGLSGPAVLRASAFGARSLHALDYRFTVQVNWLKGLSEESVRKTFTDQADVLARKIAANADPFHLPKRFWSYQLDRAGIPMDRPWGTIGKKEKNRLIDLLTNDRYPVSGKTTFKEEFVTAGGVALDEVDPITMQSRSVPGLYFAGEVLDIDGITGGFNFQAAWTTGFIAGKLEA
ncbi:MAG: NAD(P)/FAD-dependent oxidoreductase [Flavobacteriales bacterium]|nr:NAD(P)/FAD-dependent oxidoreductase [Flavobacteriales bacterium]